MESVNERRRDGRIQFSWPIWIGYEDNGELFRGQVNDLSQTHVSFTIDHHHPPMGHHVLTRFNFPKNQGDNFEIDSYLHWSEVIRVEDSPKGPGLRVALRLHRPLPNDPAEVEEELAIA